MDSGAGVGSNVLSYDWYAQAYTQCPVSRGNIVIERVVAFVHMNMDLPGQTHKAASLRPTTLSP